MGNMLVKQGKIIDTGGAASVDGKANKVDLTALSTGGTTNTTGSTITAGTYFYLNGEFVRAKTDIAANAQYTLNTNYEKVVIGNELIRLKEDAKRQDIVRIDASWHEDHAHSLKKVRLEGWDEGGSYGQYRVRLKIPGEMWLAFRITSHIWYGAMESYIACVYSPLSNSENYHNRIVVLGQGGEWASNSNPISNRFNLYYNNVQGNYYYDFFFSAGYLKHYLEFLWIGNTRDNRYAEHELDIETEIVTGLPSASSTYKKVDFYV